MCIFKRLKKKKEKRIDNLKQEDEMQVDLLKQIVELAKNEKEIGPWRPPAQCPSSRARSNDVCATGVVHAAKRCV